MRACDDSHLPGGRPRCIIQRQGFQGPQEAVGRGTWEEGNVPAAQGVTSWLVNTVRLRLPPRPSLT